MTSIVAIAVVSTTASMALYQLVPIYEDLTTAFFQYLSVSQQVSIFLLFFITIFSSVSVLVQLMTSSSDHHRNNNNKTGSHLRSTRNSTMTLLSEYPLAEIAAATNDTDKFKCVFPVIQQDILRYVQQEQELCPEGVQWIQDMIQYSVPGGKLNRGTTVLAVNRSMANVKNNNNKNTSTTPAFTALDEARSAILGWSIEFLQAFFLVADDIMDDSPTRRGQPCWYKLPHVRLIAINDSFLLESFVYTILKQHFGHEPYYHDLIELMLDVTQKTEIGQLLDLTSQAMNAKKMDLSRFTDDRYKSIVKYKTAFYSFYLPVAMGMIMAGIPYSTYAVEYQQARTICCLMGEYFQIQDDYLDCFGLPEQIGKVGTDIQDKKCSWLVVEALKICTPAQRTVIEQNYGVWDDKKVAIIKQLYRELKLEQLFLSYEEESYQSIQNELQHISPKVPKEVYLIFLDKIYKRSK
jgi:farnesyl diphosphate synthase